MIMRKKMVAADLLKKFYALDASTEAEMPTLKKEVGYSRSQMAWLEQEHRRRAALVALESSYFH
jgi:hypothetical protein